MAQKAVGRFSSLRCLVRAASAAAVLAVAGLALFLSFDAPKASAATWSATRELVAPSVQTFSPELAVNHDGLAVAAWYSGPPPRVVSYGPRTVSSATRWTGNKVVVSLGSVATGLRKPVIVATNGTDQQGQIKAPEARRTDVTEASDSPSLRGIRRLAASAVVQGLCGIRRDLGSG
jgi:hypothetical protein